MKTLLKIGLILAAAFFIFFAGLSIGFATGTIASIGSSGRFERVVNDRVILEEDIDRFVDEIVSEDVYDVETDVREFERMVEEIVVELEDGEVIVETHGRFDPDLTVIPPVPPIPDIPPVPPVPEVPPVPPVVIHHGGPSIFGFIGGLIRTFFAVTFILIGVWLIVRRSRQPVEKAPKL